MEKMQNMEKMEKKFPNFPKIPIFWQLEEVWNQPEESRGATKLGETLGLGLGQKSLKMAQKFHVLEVEIENMEKMVKMERNLQNFSNIPIFF